MIKAEGIFQDTSFSQSEIDDLKKEFSKFCETDFKLGEIPSAAGIGVWTIKIIIAGLGLAGTAILTGFFSEMGKDIYKNLKRKFREKISKKSRGESEFIVNLSDINISLFFCFPDADILEHLPHVIQELSNTWDRLNIPKDITLLELEQDESGSKWRIICGGTKDNHIYSHNKGIWERKKD
ncbi:unnamed protein product [marine sediment metagenome]|uniref:Uncharacterized protein n=1 Tax=marine sediment metagenome TaxID=412755 RepID=X1T7Z4_9ZZZZ